MYKLWDTSGLEQHRMHGNGTFATLGSSTDGDCPTNRWIIGIATCGWDACPYVCIIVVGLVGGARLCGRRRLGPSRCLKTAFLPFQFHQTISYLWCQLLLFCCFPPIPRFLPLTTAFFHHGGWVEAARNRDAEHTHHGQPWQILQIRVAVE